MFLLKSYQRKFWVVIGFSMLLAMLLLSFSEKKTPLEQSKLLCLENVKKFQAQQDTFQRLLYEKATKKRLIERFKQLRIQFKTIEFLLEYIDFKHYPYFNGANAVELEEGYNPNIKPEGLQVIEEELFNDTLDFNRILYLSKQLRYRTLAFYQLLTEATLKDTYVWEAIRLHLIRIETLSLVAFDSPLLRNNIAEIRTTFAVFNSILSFYKVDTIPIFLSLNKLLLQADIYLKAKSFNSLDRLYFIKNSIQPITKQLMALQQKLSVLYLEEIMPVFRAFNIQSKTIYATNFLNPKYYSQDRYYKDNALLSEIGKKLFFDKRLSADMKMSCASCHQPEHFFTDKMPISITNKLGEFQQRNTPSIINSALQAAYFYDFSATTLETQVNHVVINPQEFNTTYEQIIERLKADTQYVKLFSMAFPSYKEEAISAYTINSCISDFERKLIQLNSKFDKYMRGEIAYIEPSIKRGFNLFMGKAQCGSCHFAPTFFGTVPPFYSTSESEVLGVTTTFDTIKPVLDKDIGRFKNVDLEQFKFAFKTSTVRNIQFTAPYMHNGGFVTLDQVLEFYNRGGGAGLGLDISNQTLKDTPLKLSKQEKNDIITFMKALADTSISKFLLP